MYLFFIKIFWWDVRLQVWRWCLFILSWIIEEQIEVWESQRCWGWKGPLEVSLQQDHLEPISLAHIHMTFEYPQGWRLHNLPGQPVSIIGHQHSKKVFLMFRQNLLSFCAVSCPSPGHLWERPGALLFTPSLQELVHIDEPSLLQAAQPQPSGLSL